MASMGEVQVRVQVEHPLVCLNQHPEHQWEEPPGGLFLSEWGGSRGAEVEVCSRPGCGLIRVRQEKMTDPGEAAMSGEFYSRSDRPRTSTVIDETDGWEHGVCSCGQSWKANFTERTLFPCCSCGELVAAGPPGGSPKELTDVTRQEKKVKEVVEKTYIGQETNKVCGGESLSQRCERCQCLTPVSELSRDAQGRMVCKYH